jgi:hypothetical protein
LNFFLFLVFYGGGWSSRCCRNMANVHRWALSPISMISDIGLSLISGLPISDLESGVRYYIGYRNKVVFDI